MSNPFVDAAAEAINKKFFSENQARAADGKWTSDGGGGAAAPRMAHVPPGSIGDILAKRHEAAANEHAVKTGDYPPDRWLQGRSGQLMRENPGMSPKEASATALNDWNEQGKMAKSAASEKGDAVTGSTPAGQAAEKAQTQAEHHAAYQHHSDAASYHGTNQSPEHKAARDAHRAAAGAHAMAQSQGTPYYAGRARDASAAAHLASRNAGYVKKHPI